ncbi:hypothetical protein EB001_16835 [bacterium]|nr:hypothetical protein [bacterium]
MATYNNAKNILVGASPLFLSAKDSTQSGYVENMDPSDANLGTAMVSGTSYVTTLNAASAWRNVGYTNNGLQITYNPTYGSVTVDQLLDTAKLFKESMEVMIATEMTEGTLENVLAVFGQGGSNTSSDPISATNTLTTESGFVTGTTNKTKTLGLAAGALGVAPTERQLVAVGQAPTTTDGSNSKSTERVYYARRVLSVQQSQFSLARNTPTTFPVTFRLLPDGNTAYAGQEYGKIIDRILA